MKRLDWLETAFGTRHTLPPENYLGLRQIHSAIVAVAGDATVEGDALVTNRPGQWIGVRTADCAPVILADPAHQAVGVAHAGWRGAAAGVVLATLARMAVEYGTRPEDVLAEAGPSIGPCCFEVGPEVAREFAPWLPELAGAEAKVLLDLPAMLQRQLTAAGVAASNIALSGQCTRCRAELYHSYRRDREASGRMVSAARILP